MSEYREHIYGGVPVRISDGVVEGKLKRREEIVRCRDCVYGVHNPEWRPDKRFKPREVWWCHAERWIGIDGVPPFVEPDGFCYWGERKDG